MDKGATSAFNHKFYLIENLGLSPEQCECILAQMNGIIADMRVPYPTNYLVMELMAGAQTSAAEHARYGRDRSYPRNDSPEMPAFIAKIATKVSEMMPWQQDVIASYALGFWDGFAAAARDSEETMASSSATSQG